MLYYIYDIYIYVIYIIYMVYIYTHHKNHGARNAPGGEAVRKLVKVESRNGNEGQLGEMRVAFRRFFVGVFPWIPFSYPLVN